MGLALRLLNPSDSINNVIRKLTVLRDQIGSQNMNLRNRIYFLRVLLLAWRLADKFNPTNTITVLLEVGRDVVGSDEPPTVVAAAGVEIVN